MSIGILVNFLRLGRLLFLGGGFVLHGLGVAAALASGAPLNVAALVWGQVAITATQLMTHFSNEYFDLPYDRANQTPTRWTGGSRVLPDGLLAPWVALAAALVCGAAALGAVVVLRTAVGSSPLAVGLVGLGIVWSWAYSAPPFRLHARGLGEATVMLLVPGLTPLVGYALQTGRVDRMPVLVVAPLCLLQLAMQLSINFPDLAGDAASGKRTLAVRLGQPRAAHLHNIALAAAYLALPLLVWMELPVGVAAAALTLAPIAAWQLWRVARGAGADPRCWSSLIEWNIVLVMGSAALEAVALVGLAGMN